MEKQLKSIKFPGLEDIYIIPEGGGTIDIDLTGANEGEIAPVNADTLGGIPAEDYIKKTVGVEDEGKFLRVVNGVATWASIPNVREGSF